MSEDVGTVQAFEHHGSIGALEPFEPLLWNCGIGLGDYPKTGVGISIIV